MLVIAFWNYSLYVECGSPGTVLLLGLKVFISIGCCYLLTMLAMAFCVVLGLLYLKSSKQFSVWLQVLPFHVFECILQLYIYMSGRSPKLHLFIFFVFCYLGFSSYIVWLSKGRWFAIFHYTHYLLFFHFSLEYRDFEAFSLLLLATICFWDIWFKK